MTQVNIDGWYNTFLILLASYMLFGELVCGIVAWFLFLLNILPVIGTFIHRRG